MNATDNHQEKIMTAITSENFPEAFAAMDAAAKEFWAYPDEKWQESFLRHFAEERGDQDLMDALGPWAS